MGLSTHKPFIVSAPTRSRCVETFEKIGQRLREYDPLAGNSLGSKC